jgi:hypothetical protein
MDEARKGRRRRPPVPDRKERIPKGPPPIHDTFLQLGREFKVPLKDKTKKPLETNIEKKIGKEKVKNPFIPEIKGTPKWQKDKI